MVMHGRTRHDIMVDMCRFSALVHGRRRSKIAIDLAFDLFGVWEENEMLRTEIARLRNERRAD